MRTPRSLAVLLVLVLAVAAACGDDDDASTTTAAATASSGAEPAAQTGGGETETAGSATSDAASATEEPTASGTASGEATGSSAGEAPDDTAAADALALPTGPDGCTHVEPPTAGGDRRSYDGPPSSGLPSGATGVVRMETSCGTIDIELDRDVGGQVAESFAGLIRDGFYDGLTFHRVVPDFVLQGGDPDGNGGGGPGYEVTQAPPASYVYAKGDVAMAKLPTDAAGTAGSQFFIVVSPQGASALGGPGDPPLYAVVGHVLDDESLQAVARIAALGVGDGAPVEPVWIWRATLEDR